MVKWQTVRHSTPPHSEETIGLEVENFTTDAYMAMMPTLVDLYYGIFLWCRLSVTLRKRQANSLCTKPSEYGTRSLSATLARNSISFYWVWCHHNLFCLGYSAIGYSVRWRWPKRASVCTHLDKKIRCEGSMYVCNAICLSELSLSMSHISTLFKPATCWV